MARRMAAGELETAWFERTARPRSPRCRRTGRTTTGSSSSGASSSSRLTAIIGLIERPEYKRRWTLEPWEKMEEEALRAGCSDRLEEHALLAGEPALTSSNRLADHARSDADFMQVAELYTGRPDFDLAALVRDLVLGESVPFLPVLRYTESGLRKRAEWERTWELQREEDADRRARRELPEGDPDRLTPEPGQGAQGEGGRRHPGAAEVHVRADFLRTDYWRLRGGLDVPKERFVSYPYCERDADGSPVVSWAGYDHCSRRRRSRTTTSSARSARAGRTSGSCRCSPGCASCCPGSASGTTSTTARWARAWATTSPTSCATRRVTSA